MQFVYPAEFGVHCRHSEFALKVLRKCGGDQAPVPNCQNATLDENPGLLINKKLTNLQELNFF